MRVLLDNNIPIRFAALLGPSHDVVHVRDRGWQALINGELVALASEQFDVLVTVDRNMQFQTSLTNLRLSVLVLTAPSNRLADLVPLVPLILAQLDRLPTGSYVLLS